MMKDIVTQNNLIAIIDGEPMTTSLALAEGTGVQHKNVMELIRNYLDDLQQFGNIAFETRKSTSGAGRPTEIANLNEPQSILDFSNEVQKSGSVLRTKAINFFSKKMFISRLFYFLSNIGVLVAISRLSPKLKNIVGSNVYKELIERLSLKFSYFFDTFIFVFGKSNLRSLVIILLCQVKNSLTLNLVSYNISVVGTDFSVFLKRGQQ